MRRVVVFTPYYWPEKAPSVPLMRDLCEDLVQYGFHVCVITSLVYRGLTNAERMAFLRRRRTPEVISGVHLRRVPLLLAGRKSLWSRALEYATFTLWCIIYALILPADVFFVSSTPPLLGLPLGIIGRLRRIPVVYNLQDLFPESAVRARLINRGLAFCLLQMLEKACYRVVDTVIAISPHFQRHVSSLVPSARVQVIPNWIDTNLTHYVPREENRFLKVLGQPNSFLVVYAGNIGLLQGLDSLLEAARELSTNPAIRFVVVGDGPHKANLIQKAKKLGLANVDFLPFQPEEWIPDVYSAADVCLVPLRQGAGFASVPSKTWTIMACARPIIACTEPDSELARVVQVSGAGRVVPPEDAHSLAEAILVLLENQDTARTCGENGRRYVIEHLGRQDATLNYAQVISRCCN